MSSELQSSSAGGFVLNTEKNSMSHKTTINCSHFRSLEDCIKFRLAKVWEQKMRKALHLNSVNFNSHKHDLFPMNLCYALSNELY